MASLVAAGGRPRPTPYGRSVVLFAGPATAARAAAAAGTGRESVGLAVAEVAREGQVAGPAVQLACALAELATAGEVLASATVGVLLGGSGVQLTPAGVHDVGVGRPQQVLRLV